MARKRQSPLEDLIEIVSKLPWWAGAALAIISYFILHQFATSKIPPLHGMQEIGAVMQTTLWHGFATAGQYLLPLTFGMGSIISVVNRRRRRHIFERTVASTAPSVLDGLDWREFEELVGEYYRRQGYAVLVTPEGADGGVDLVLKRDGEKFLVQCKHWKALKVGVQVVRELYGVMAAEGAVGGVVVTSGQFTAEAAAFASGRNITLIDGSRLTAMLRDVQPAGSPAPAPAQTSQPASPPCPRCGGEMVRRTAKRGANAGNAFWGCSAYPACRGTRN